MSSFQERYESFKNWPIKSKICTPGNLAAAFFFRTKKCSIDGAECVLCNKNLEGWEPEDIPIKEHTDHQNSCPLFSLNLLKSRIKTFKFIDVDLPVVNLAKHGFIMMKLKKTSKYDLFCYRCGYYINDHDSINETECQNHYRECKSRGINRTNFFVHQFLNGKFNDIYLSLFKKEICIPKKLKKKYENLIFFDEKTHVKDRKILNIKDGMQKRFFELKERVNQMLNDEIDIIMNDFERKYELEFEKK